jgi:hypothetical protein
LEEKNQQSRQGSTLAGSARTSPSRPASGHEGHTPQSVATSPEAPKEKEKGEIKENDVKRGSIAPAEANKDDEEDVEALSDMMCSLVTNQSGETRYLGEYLVHCHNHPTDACSS